MHHLRPGKICKKARHPVHRQAQVGPRGHGNLIAPSRIHHDHSSARMHPGNGREPIHPNPLRRHALTQLRAKRIITYTPDEAHVSPESASRNGLIRPLTTVVDEQRPARDRLPRGRQTLGQRHNVDIDRAHDENTWCSHRYAVSSLTLAHELHAKRPEIGKLLVRLAGAQGLQAARCRRTLSAPASADTLPA